MTLDKLRCRKGYTLVELLVVIAIMGIVVSAAYTFLFTNQSIYFSIMSRITAQSETRNAINNVMTNIRRADQRELAKIINGNTLTLKIPNSSGILVDCKYTVEKNVQTNLYELIFTKDTVKFVIATNIDSETGFVVSKNGMIISVKIKTLKKIYNQATPFEIDNYHEIKVDI